MQTGFNYEELRNGDILHYRSATFTGWLIRRVIKSWGNHDALAFRSSITGTWYSADSEPPHAALNPLEAAIPLMKSGHWQIRVYRPICFPNVSEPERGRRAASWWVQHINGTIYDFMAYPRLILKAIFGDWLPWAAGWEWAWYCTEGVRAAWKRGGHTDPWAKENPTPRTTERRVAQKRLEDVTTHCILSEEA